MRKFRIGMMICCLIIIVVEIILFLFTDLTGAQQIGSVVTTIGLILTIVSLVIGARNEEKQKTTDSTL